jgi:crotonobetainyl-CoA:carnitine CoA-transferase CaiB-like acyl-CoA transferase
VSRPFEGIRVLDLTHVLAGPFCTYLLALLGAETIKIEPPDEPDEVRGRGADSALNAIGMGMNYLTQGANKKAITLNLKTENGREILKQLAAAADVMVENYRTGALRALGLGYEDIRAVNPRIVYCSMTGFGQSGPRAQVNAYDNVIQAASGLMSLTGTKEAHPLKAGAPIIDYAAGVIAAFAIASALLKRERTGQGVQIDCAMLDTALMLMGTHVTNACAKGAAPAEPQGNDQKEAGLSCYETADGLLMMGAFNRRQHERLWQAFHRPDFAAKSSWQEMADYAPEMRAELRRLLKEKSAAEWERYFHERSIPAERVRTVKEAIAIADAPGRAFTALLDPVVDGGESLRVPASPFQFSTGGPLVTSPPPRMGEHNREILGELGYTEEDVERLKSQGVI